MTDESNPSGLDAVVFDMDGVLCHLCDEARFGWLSRRVGCTSDHIRSVIFDSGFEDRSDRGELGSAEYLKGFGERLGYALTVQEYVAYRKAGMTPIADTLKIVRELGPMCQLALLTNNGALLTEQIDLIFPELRPLFGANLFCSANFRVQKPDPESYVRLCLTIGAEPSRTLMIDDMNVNVVGARAAGLRAHWFKSPQALRMALQVFFPSLAV